MKNIGMIIGDLMLKTKQNLPEILTAIGIGGAIAGTVVACIETPKAVAEINKTKNKVKDLKESDYIPSSKRNLIALEYVKLGGRLALNYLPAIVIEGGSIASLVGAANVNRNRRAALASSLLAVETAYHNYRQSVANRYGDQAEYDLYHGISRETVTKTTEDEKGKKKKTETEKIKIDPTVFGKHSPYARLFDECNPNWSKDPKANETFLVFTQNWANSKLNSVGYLLLNDVYDALGLEKTKAGQVIGWRKRDSKKYVDFGFYRSGPAYDAFMSGLGIYLDFNVDGDIVGYTGKISDAKECLDY